MIEIPTGFKVDNVGEDDEETSKWIDMHFELFNKYKIPKITCICQKEVPLQESFRCRMCGIWLCSDCSLDHFGLYVTKSGKVKVRKKRAKERNAASKEIK